MTTGLLINPVSPLYGTPPEFLDNSISHFTSRIKNSNDWDLYFEFLQNPTVWDEPMVGIDTFINDPLFLGIGEFLYPEIRKQVRNIIQGKYNEAVFVAGIGSGKTMTSEIIACYYAYKLMCMKNPHNFYRLISDKPITILNMGTTATQALDVTFAGIKRFIENSPWFMDKGPNILAGSIKFDRKNVLLFSGNSQSRTALGYNVFCGILDEAAFYQDNDKRQVAEEIYTAMQRRVVSRFRGEGLSIMISSPNYDGDFVMRKLREAVNSRKRIYCAQLPTWKCKPFRQEDKATCFYFNNRKGLVLDIAPTNYGEVCKLEDPFNPYSEVWEVPFEYKPSFLQDPDKAKRDFAAIPSKSIQGFMPHIEIIDRMFTEDISPLEDLGGYKFKERPLRANYYVHLDLALNRNGKGDKAGFAMAHAEGLVKDPLTGEMRPKIVVDLAEQIKAGPTGEIQFSDVRSKIYALIAIGFNIALVTADTYQSADTAQIFRQKGIRFETLSVDRTIDPYQTLKELIYGERVKCHKMEVLREELSRLEISKANKVDHPPGYSKDVSDAICGACFNAVINAGKDVGVFATDYTPAPTKVSNTSFNPDATVQEKIDYYNQIQGYIDRGYL